MNLGILSGGGDCQGINAAIRAVVKTSRGQYNWEVTGFLSGWKGVLENQWIPLDSTDVSGILPSGGTILGTSRVNPARHPNGIALISEILKTDEIDALIVLGGRDTLGVALQVSRAGFPIVGIPTTVDNDVARTDFSIGFQSAVSVVTDAIDKLRTTASAHHRVVIVEVMGRNSGWVALYGGLSGGADWIIIPEIQPHFGELMEHLKNRRKRGKNFSIIVVAEGATLPEVPVADVREADEYGQIRMDKRNVGSLIGREIEKITGFETRVTVLGHLQRGGPPAAADRILATQMGVEAVELVRSKKYGRVVTFRNNQIGSEDLARVIKESPRMVPINLYNMARTFY